MTASAPTLVVEDWKPIGRNPLQMADPTTGKLQWSPIVGFETKQISDRFSAQVIEALRRAFPTALPDPAGAVPAP